jgi:hypothetical protein
MEIKESSAPLTAFLRRQTRQNRAQKRQFPAKSLRTTENTFALFGGPEKSSFTRIFRCVPLAIVRPEMVTQVSHSVSVMRDRKRGIMGRLLLCDKGQKRRSSSSRNSLSQMRARARQCASELGILRKRLRRFGSVKSQTTSTTAFQVLPRRAALIIIIVTV